MQSLKEGLFFKTLLTFSLFRHNAEPFSKLAFGMGKYKEFDMENLDITIARDYATYMALTANNQGRNGQTALDKFRTKVGNYSWGEICRDHWQTEP